MVSLRNDGMSIEQVTKNNRVAKRSGESHTPQIQRRFCFVPWPLVGDVTHSGTLLPGDVCKLVVGPQQHLLPKARIQSSRIDVYISMEGGIQIRNNYNYLPSNNVRLFSFKLAKSKCCMTVGGRKLCTEP